MALDADRKQILEDHCGEALGIISKHPQIKHFLRCFVADQISTDSLAAMERIAASSNFQIDLKELVVASLTFYYMIYELKTGDAL